MSSRLVSSRLLSGNLMSSRSVSSKAVSSGSSVLEFFNGLVRNTGCSE